MKAKKRVSALLLLCVVFSVRAGTAGSNSAASRQLKTFFPAAHTNNLMTGFAVFEDGFTFEDSATTCTFDAFFPVSGNIALNGGVLHLARDLVFKSPLYVGPGMICGHGYSVNFPNNISELTIPTLGHEKLLTLVDEVEIGRYVRSVDWSFDDQYLAMVSHSSGSVDELQIFYFDGMVLTLTASLNTAQTGYAVTWHPSDYYFAIGQNSGTELRSFYFDPNDGSLTEKDSINFGRVYGLDWHPSGDYLAVGKSSSSQLYVYDIADGMFGAQYTTYFETNESTNRTVQINALEWDMTGSYLAAGLNNNSSYADVEIFHFDGTTLSKNAEADLGAHAYAVSWSPTGSWLAVGRSGGSQRLELYKHDPVGGTLTKKLSAGENRAPFGLDWTPDGKYLAMGRDSASDHLEVRVFCFDQENLLLNMVGGYNLSNDARTVRWSHDGAFLATGDLLDYVRVFKLDKQPLVIDDTKLFFGSDVLITGQLRFTNSCIINASNHIITLGENASCVIADGASVTFEQAALRGLSGNNIYCEGDSSTITLRDVVWLQDNDFTFSTGALHFKNDVVMAGDATFAYQSNQTSTIAAKSRLTLDVGFTFSYDPIMSASKDLLVLEDGSSKLCLDGATLHTTVTGMNLTKGQVDVVRDSFLKSEDFYNGVSLVNEGITLGGGVAANDCKVEIFSGVMLKMQQGALNYKNVDLDSWNMISDTSVLRMHDSTTLCLYENLDLGNGTIVFGGNTKVKRASGKRIIGSVHTLGSVSFLNL